MDTMLEVSVSAYEGLYRELSGDGIMCDALRGLMKDEIAQDIANARDEGIDKGLDQGICVFIEDKVEDGIPINILQSQNVDESTFLR